MSKVQVPVVVAAVACILAVATACGQQPAGSPAPGTGASSSSSGVATACGAAAPQAGRTVTITVSDNAKKLCVKTGTEVLVLLRGTPKEKWAPIHSNSAALAPKADTRLALQVGVTGAAFEAAHQGVATITSARNPCGPATVHPPTMECGVILEYRVTLVMTA